MLNVDQQQTSKHDISEMGIFKRCFLKCMEWVLQVASTRQTWTKGPKPEQNQVTLGNGHYSNSKKCSYNVHGAEIRSSCHVRSKGSGHEWRSLGKLVIERKLEAIKINEERMHVSWLTQTL